MSSKLRLKTFLTAALQHTGLLHLLKNCRTSNQAFILMYHRVIASLKKEQISVQSGMYVTRNSFQKQAEFLKQHFHVLPLTELVRRIENGRSISGCCALTFDDGWLDNSVYAYPVLQELNLPATIFLATGFVGTKRLFWPEEVTFYLGQADVLERGRDNTVLKSFVDKIPKKGLEEIRLDQSIVLLKAMSPAKREEVISTMRGLSVASLPDRMLMNWDEVRRMQAGGLVDFGAHSHNHVILDQVPLEEVEKEILLSRQEMERQLSIVPDLFAYPNGNHTSEVQRLLKKHGFKAAVSTRKGWFDRNVSSFEIPRIGMHEDVSNTTSMFFARILLRRF